MPRCPFAYVVSLRPRPCTHYTKVWRSISSTMPPSWRSSVTSRPAPGGPAAAYCREACDHPAVIVQNSGQRGLIALLVTEPGLVPVMLTARTWNTYVFSFDSLATVVLVLVDLVEVHALQVEPLLIDDRYS